LPRNKWRYGTTRVCFLASDNWGRYAAWGMGKLVPGQTASVNPTFALRWSEKMFFGQGVSAGGLKRAIVKTYPLAEVGPGTLWLESALLHTQRKRQAAPVLGRGRVASAGLRQWLGHRGDLLVDPRLVNQRVPHESFCQGLLTRQRYFARRVCVPGARQGPTDSRLALRQHRLYLRRSVGRQHPPA